VLDQDSKSMHHFKFLYQDKVKMLCKMCEVKIYQTADVIDLKSGGVLLKGEIMSAKKIYEAKTNNEKTDNYKKS
jgi:hypothetical protein